MPTILLCPRCQRPVCLPAGVDWTALVRCPLCDGEYALNEALPPELISLEPVDGPIEAAAAKPSAEIVVEERPQQEPENTATAVSERISLATARLRRPTPKSKLSHVFGKLIGLAVSGLFGCLIAYYALAWSVGPQFRSYGWPVLTFLPGITSLTVLPGQIQDAQESPAADLSATESDEAGK